MEGFKEYLKNLLRLAIAYLAMIAFVLVLYLLSDYWIPFVIVLIGFVPCLLAVLKQ